MGVFLNLEIKFEPKNINVQLYDKKIQKKRMSHLTRNIFSKMFYSAFGVEIFRAIQATQMSIILENNVQNVQAEWWFQSLYKDID